MSDLSIAQSQVYQKNMPKLKERSEEIDRQVHKEALEKVHKQMLEQFALRQDHRTHKDPSTFGRLFLNGSHTEAQPKNPTVLNLRAALEKAPS